MQSSLFFSDVETPRQEVQLELLHSSESGFSQIYRVDKEGKFRVLKCLRPQFRGNPAFETLLRKEFEIGYPLDHPNICSVIAMVRMEELGNCIEMEWVDGCTLTELLGRRELSKALENNILLELCSAMEYIHSKQIIHRVIKPDNILVTHNGGNVKLIDFGLSDTDYHTAHKESAGTQIYASPEQVRGEALDARSDIYSLGRVIFELSDRFNRIALKCMSREPDKRYGTVGQVRQALEKRMRSRLGAIIATAALLGAVAFGAYVFSAKADSAAGVFKAVTQEIIDAQEE